MLIVHQQCLTYNIFVMRKATICFATYSTPAVIVHPVKQKSAKVEGHSRA